MADEPESLGAVVRSALDNRVWFASLAGSDIMSSEGHCSVSVQRVKRYVRREASRFADVDPADTVWVRTDDDVWDLYARDGVR